MVKSKLDPTKYPKKNDVVKTKPKKLGRPTKYKNEFCQMLIDWFDIEPTIEKEVIYTNKKGETWSKFETVAVDIPTFEGFSHSIDVEDRTLENWYKAKRSNGSPRYPDFFRAYNRAKQLQRKILVTNALAGRYNSSFAMFYAKNVTDMREKVEVPVDDKGNAVPLVSGFQFIVPKGNNDGGKTDNNPED